MSIPTLLPHSVADDARTTPKPQHRGSMPDELVCSALRVVPGLSRGGDGLDRLIYGVGTGVSWKPIAAALRSSTLSVLAFILASYSSIDWVT